MLRLLFAFALLNLYLLALEIPRYAGFGPNGLALEALVLVGLFILLPPGRYSNALAWVVGVLLGLLTLLTVADALTRISLSRPVNVYLDYPLLRSVYHLIDGNASLAGAILVPLALLAAFGGIVLLFRRLLGRLPSRPVRAPPALAIALLLVGTAGITAFHAGPAVPNLPRAITPGLTLALDQIKAVRRAHREERRFATVLEERPETEAGRALPGLAGTDVIIGFIESYGVSSVFDPRYAPVVGPRLDTLEAEVAAANLTMVSGVLDAPIFGGQSWLAHASVLSGLWIDSQMRYEFLLATERGSLARDFERTGHRTAMLMPAINLPWPEGRWYGFEAIYESADMAYTGPPFNWVAMPDQYTWSFLENTVRRSDARPVFALLALLSSHAPWVPILPVLDDWDQIGDGRIFRQWEGLGEAPERLWLNPDRVREHYAESVAYAVQVAGAYATRYTDPQTLLILLGDHQPARLITGLDPAPGVPVHVISGDPALLEPFRARGFVDGAWPPEATSLGGLDDLRGWLQHGFGTGPTFANPPSEDPR